MATPPPLNRADSGESCDEEDLALVLDCLEATAEMELVCHREESMGKSTRLDSPGVSNVRPLALELMSAELALQSDTAGLEGNSEELWYPDGRAEEAVAAAKIQRVWRKHVRSMSRSQTHVVNVDRVNPFASSESGNINLRLASSTDVDDNAADMFSEDDMSPGQQLDPTFHLATVAAKLCTLESHERHVEEITQEVPPSEDEREESDDEAITSERRAKLLASSMQICFTRRQNTDLMPQLPTGGRESRGAADGASSGSPVATDDERSELLKPAKVRSTAASKTASSSSILSRASVEGASDTAVAISSPDTTSPLSTVAGRQRENQVFDDRLLSQLSVMHLLSLREKFENDIHVMSSELVQQLTVRDALVAEREEYNHLFRQYTKMEKEPQYGDSAVLRPPSFQEPSPATKPSTGGLLARTRNAIKSKVNL